MAALVFMYLLMLSFQFNINSSNLYVLIAKESLNLIGKCSSSFPGNNFLLFLLYGHANVNFTLKDIYQNFRTNAKAPGPGFLIIGNDYNLGATIDDEAKNFIVALPGKTIQSIPIRLVNNYFPKGYIMKETSFYVATYELEINSAKINSVEYCTPCGYSVFNFDINAGKFDDNKMWVIELASKSKGFYFLTYGYLQSYDISSGNGNIQPIFYEWTYESNAGEGFYSNSGDSFNFSQNTTQMNFILHGTILFDDANSTLDVSGTWVYK